MQGQHKPPYTWETGKYCVSRIKKVRVTFELPIEEAVAAHQDPHPAGGEQALRHSTFPAFHLRLFLPRIRSQVRQLLRLEAGAGLIASHAGRSDARTQARRKTDKQAPSPRN